MLKIICEAKSRQEGETSINSFKVNKNRNLLLTPQPRPRQAKLCEILKKKNNQNTKKQVSFK